MEFAKNLRQFMTDKGLTVAKLSEKSGIPAKTLYHWLAGQKPRNIEQVFLLCDALDVNVEALYGRARKKEAVRIDTLPNPQELAKILESEAFELVLRPARKPPGS